MPKVKEMLKIPHAYTHTNNYKMNLQTGNIYRDM